MLGAKAKMSAQRSASIRAEDLPYGDPFVSLKPPRVALRTLQHQLPWNPDACVRTPVWIHRHVHSFLRLFPLPGRHFPLANVDLR